MANTQLPFRLNQYQPCLLGLFRIVVGLLFTSQGAASLFGVLGREVESAGTWPYWYAAVIELVCGMLVTLGVGTRSAAFVASGVMAYAYFTVHQPDGLFPLQNKGEGAALYCWAFLLLVFSGPGALSLDSLLPSRGRTVRRRRGDKRGSKTTVA
jgi:putative oxidoreductase